MPWSRCTWTLGTTLLAFLGALATAGAAHTVGAQQAEAIRWEPFPLASGGKELVAQLGRLRVPQVRPRISSSGPAVAPGATANAKASGMIDLAFVRLQATKRGTGSPVVYLAGGPGQDAISSARFAPALESFARMARDADVILLDQRGTGLSTPRPFCAPKVPLEPSDRFDARVSGAARLAAIVSTVRQCVAEWQDKGVDARAFTNRESAADIEDLRRALGVAKVSLYGFSYGTHLALVAMHDFPSAIDRAVLVGTAGPDDLRKLPSISDLQFAKLSYLVANSPAIGREVPDLTALLRRVLARLDTQPVPVTVLDRTRRAQVTVTIGGDALRGMLLQDLGDGNDLPVFPALLLTIERGDASILEWFVEKRYNEQTGAISLMPYGMRCSAGATVQLEQRRQAEVPQSPLRNAMNGSFPDVCNALPLVDDAASIRAPWASEAAVLFISGTLDNNTPPYQAERLRWGMPNARHLIVQNAGHEDMQPIPAVGDAIVDWLRGKDVSDRHIALPAPKFLSVDDARRERHRSKP